MSVVIVDTGMGNVAAVQNMLTWVGVPSEALRRPPTKAGSAHFLLPGVGSFDEGVRLLQNTGWYSFLKECSPETPILGICLGMQLLGLNSEEGDLEGLGRLDINYHRFKSVARVPHMGWNDVHWTERPTNEPPVLDAIPGDRYYFTHSFAGRCEDSNQILGTTVYGSEFHSACKRDGTVGYQFHPEKSHTFGKTLLQRWYRLGC